MFFSIRFQLYFYNVTIVFQNCVFCCFMFPKHYFFVINKIIHFFVDNVDKSVNNYKYLCFYCDLFTTFLFVKHNFISLQFYLTVYVYLSFNNTQLIILNIKWRAITNRPYISRQFLWRILIKFYFNKINEYLQNVSTH